MVELVSTERFEAKSKNREYLPMPPIKFTGRIGAAAC